MADNSTQGGADTIRDKDRAGVKTQVFGLDTNIGGASEVLQTAAALADATANPTVPAWAALGLLFNGTTWDRMRGDTTNGLDVDVTRLPGSPAQEHTTAASPASARLSDGAAFYDATKTGQLPAALVGGRLDVNLGALTGSNIPVANVETLADNAGFTDGTSKVFPQGYIFDESAGTALTENDVAAARVDSKRAVVNVLEDATTRGRRAVVSATGGLLGDQGAPAAQANAWYIRPRQVATYGAGYRLAVATAGPTYLAFTFTANTDKQLATIYHAATATKTVRLRYVSVTLVAAAAGIFELELRALSATTAPATGNPAVTPRTYDPADTAAEATCLALPTTAGSEAAANGPVSPTFTWNSAATATTADPARAGQELVLYDMRQGTWDRKPLAMRAATAEGFAVIGRCSAAAALNFTVYAEFTEE